MDGLIRLEKPGPRARVVTIEMDGEAVIVKTNGKLTLRNPHQGDLVEARRIIDQQVILQMVRGAELKEAPAELMDIPLLQCEVSLTHDDIHGIEQHIPRVRGWKSIKPGARIIDFATAEIVPVVAWLHSFDACSIGVVEVAQGDTPGSSLRLLSKVDVKGMIVRHLEHYPAMVIDWARKKGVLEEIHEVVSELVFY